MGERDAQKSMFGEGTDDKFEFDGCEGGPLKLRLGRGSDVEMERPSLPEAGKR
jgi:hypothetical protein